MTQGIPKQQHALSTQVMKSTTKNLHVNIGQAGSALLDGAAGTESGAFLAPPPDTTALNDKQCGGCPPQAPLLHFDEHHGLGLWQR